MIRHCGSLFSDADQPNHLHSMLTEESKQDQPGEKADIVEIIEDKPLETKNQAEEKSVKTKSKKKSEKKPVQSKQSVP